MAVDPLARHLRDLIVALPLAMPGDHAAAEVTAEVRELLSTGVRSDRTTRELLVRVAELRAGGPGERLPPTAVHARAVAFAVDALAERAGLVPATASSALALGDAALLARRPARALELFAKARELGDQPGGLIGSARALNMLHRSREALANCQTALAVGAPDAPVLFAMVTAYLTLGRADQGLPLCDQWVALERQHKSLEHRAACFAGIGRPADALNDLAEASSLSPDEPCLVANRAAALQAVGRHAEGITAARMALSITDRLLRLSPEDFVCHRIRAQAFRLLGRADQVVDECGKALKRWSGDPYLLSTRGWAYLHLDAPERSLADFEATGVNLQDDRVVRLGTAEALRRLGRHRDSLQALGESEPGRNDGSPRGMAHAGLGDHETAIEHFEAALRTNPADYITHYNLAWSLYETGRKDEALRELKQFLTLHPFPELGRRYAMRDADFARMRGDSEVGREFRALMRLGFSLRQYLAERGLLRWPRPK